MATDEKKDGDDAATGGEVISLEEVRRRLDEQMQKSAAEQTQKLNEGADPANPNGTAVNNFLAPVMAAIAQQLQGMAGPDGVVRVDGNASDAASKEKTAAVLKGLGIGLGAALAEAFGKWADKIQIKVDTSAPAPSKKPEDDPNKQ